MPEVKTFVDWCDNKKKVEDSDHAFFNDEMHVSEAPKSHMR